MTGNEIRKRFIQFFEEREHTVVPSSPLVPQNDPTLLFTNAGMVQFKSIFVGDEARPYPRATSSQKCVRAGGKHNDLENVGRTARHHTFFEMLGNFSFGDYFKERAIELAWEFVTKDLGLPAERLLVTVYAEDDEAYDIWCNKVGLPADKVIKIPTSDNFWSMGDTGPCGPCSEIFYDFGSHIPGGPPGSPDEDGDRFVEIWNLVFMQFNRDTEGNLNPLPKPSIDTGAGLERIAAILQGKTNNYDSDLFQPIIAATAELAQVTYGEETESTVSLRVIADHLRAVCFLIADGVLPSNEGRGYVLRRILRRGLRHGRLLGFTQPFMYQLVPVLIREMGEAYPQLKAEESTITIVMENEEKRFLATLDVGLKILEEALQNLQGNQLDGATIFQLYDTFGFPVDLTADIVVDRGITLDHAGFEARMEEQKARARAAWSGSGEQQVDGLYRDLRERVGAVEFLGYRTEQASGSIVALVRDGEEVERLEEGESGTIILNQTPFYGESGGQMGDRGVITVGESRFSVNDCKKPLMDFISHQGKVKQGTVQVGDEATLEVDHTWRQGVGLHHSATHYLHHGLRQVLGDHVKQAGSMVTANRLRFDFSHFKAMTPDEVSSVESMVNRLIMDNDGQTTTVMTPDEAIEAGAMALFGEKYGESVRVVKLGPSVELCGGTHVSRSGDIGLCKVVSESAVAAGVRRIEAVCGDAAHALINSHEAALKSAAQTLKVSPGKVAEALAKVLDKQKSLERELKKAGQAQAGQLVEQLASKVTTVAGVSLLAVAAKEADPKGLRELMDRLKDAIKSGVIVVAVPQKARVALIVGVTKDLTKRVKAGELVGFIAKQIGGKGGGRPDLAQGGGTDPSKLTPALESVPGWLSDKLS